MRTILRLFLAMNSILWLGTLAASGAATFQPDIEYGTVDGQSLKLDACVPDGNGPFAAVILVHGGGWNAGDKNGGPSKGYMVPMQEPLSQAGFAWFSINYRLAPKYPYPACIEDVETAIRWVKAHAAEFHVDPKRIAISGESAGGHLVALAAVRATDATRVAGVVPFYGPFDLIARVKPNEPLADTMQALFATKEFDARTQALMKEASPINFVKPGLPPFLLVHGSVDTRVDFSQSTNFQAALQKVGVPCELIKVEGGNHGMIGWANLNSDYQAKVVAWLQRTLGPTASGQAKP